MKAAIAATFIFCLAVISCADDVRDIDAADSSKTRDGVVDTTTRLTQNLPSGRFQLPTQATAAPDLWITLPDGYRVKSASDSVDDRFYVVHTDDPSLTDSSTTTPGFMLLYVGRTEQRPFEGVKTTDGERVMVIGQPLQWRTASESTPTGGRYYQADIGSADVFGRLSSELARARMHLHIYVAGNDSSRVADLMRSAESISIVP
ncbi:MAG: hypothetical protein H7X80_02135 [bacterium]|nr:hypothetical protein [Candidatus Kapabacteria bacterium]